MYRCYRVVPTLSLTQICAVNIFVDSLKPTFIGQTLHHSPEGRPSEVLRSRVLGRRNPITSPRPNFATQSLKRSRSIHAVRSNELMMEVNNETKPLIGCDNVVGEAQGHSGLFSDRLRVL